MLKKTISYVDYDGNHREEDYYFNFSKVELARLATQNELVNSLKGIANEKDPAKIMDAFEKIVKMSLGKKSDDGRRFVKSAAYTEEFMDSLAYSELVIELMQNGAAAAAFVNAIIPDISAVKPASAPEAK